jgi:hypothetical protein
MRQYTFLNTTKILYGTSLMNAIDITLTIKSYLEANENTISFQVLETFFKNVWANQIRRLYIYDQHYIVSPCEITERPAHQFKILLTTGGTTTIKKNQNVKKLTSYVEKELPSISSVLERTEPASPQMSQQKANVPRVVPQAKQTEQTEQTEQTHKIFKTQTNQQNKLDNKTGVTLTYTKVKLPIVQLLKNCSSSCETNKKVCFLFMVYDRLNKPEIWENFFELADTSKYSIFVHSKCDLIDNQLQIIKNNLIENRYPTEWGTWSLVEVQNRLLEIGLKDPLNTKFIFMSDSHIPLHDFDTVYNCIINNEFSFIDIVGRLTQNNTNTMNDVFNIGKSNMFKMSQWSCLNRKHAEQLLEHEAEMKLQSQFSIIPDENAYICTLSGLYFPKKIENLYNKNFTFVDWVIPSTNKMYRAFPRTYDGNELTKLLPTLRNEFLFVRKVSPNCNVTPSVIQSYALTISAYPQFSNMIRSSNKIIVSVYCKHTKNTSADLRNFWGFGDMIRGTISIYKLSQEFGSQFYLDTLDHPIGKYLKKQQTIQGYEDFIAKSKNNIYTFYRYFELSDFVKRNLITSNFVAVHSNAVFKDRNNMIENENSTFLSDSDKTNLLKYFEPTEELNEAIKECQNKLPEHYNIIHFRIGDDYFDSNINQLHLEELESIFIKHYESCDVLLTDNNYFKQYIKNKYNCLTLDTNIVHVGLSENSCGIKETLVEWFIQAKSSKIKTYSCYGWLSGFVYWTHQLFGIPLVNMKKIK